MQIQINLEDDIIRNLNNYVERDGSFPYMASVDTAAYRGYEKILEWYGQHWQSHDRKFKLLDCDSNLIYSVRAIDGASAQGHIRVLNWFDKLHAKNSIPFKYTHVAFDNACKYGHLDIVTWFVDRKDIYPLLYTENAINYASKYGHIDVLNYLLRCHIFDGLELRCTSCAVDYIADNLTDDVHISILNCWRNYSQIPFLHTTEAVDMASRNCKLKVLQWFWDHREEIPFKYSERSIHMASVLKHIPILDWWVSLRDHIELKYTCEPVDCASHTGAIDVLQWWLLSPLEFKFSSYGIKFANSLSATFWEDIIIKTVGHPINVNSINDDFECAICLRDDKDDCTELACKHVFHSLCIEKWVTINASCPYCKSIIPLEFKVKSRDNQKIIIN
jgi:hypothetical protein